MSSISDRELPEITDAMMRQAMAKNRHYTLMILKKGPHYAMPGVEKIIWEHGRRNFALRAAGLLSIVCPVGDGSDVTGVGIFDAPPDEVERIYAADPGVTVGVFTFEVHACRSFPGDCLPN